MDKIKSLRYAAKQAIAKIEASVTDLEAGLSADNTTELLEYDFGQIKESFDNIVIRPCKDVIEGKSRDVANCDPSEAEYWSLYASRAGYLFWMADLKSEKAAKNLENWLRSFAFLWRTTEQQEATREICQNVLNIHRCVIEFMKNARGGVHYGAVIELRNLVDDNELDAIMIAWAEEFQANIARKDDFDIAFRPDILSRFTKERIMQLGIERQKRMDRNPDAGF